MSSIANSEAVQNLQNGPVAEAARSEINQTKNEFSNLASARQVPEHTAATGQSLTHYHSFFYTLLSWENPRVTSISYAALAGLILATRYLSLFRYTLRLTWIVLGTTAAIELAGQLALGQGVVSKMKPKRYYTIPRQTLEAALEDVEQLINFFVIEVQRIVFAENVYKTIAAFLTAFITYFLIKIMPSWGLALLGLTAVYFVPLIYISNKEFIDSHLESASNIITEQTNQVRDIASQQTNKAVEMSSAAFKDYSQKAQEMIGSAKQSAVDKGIVSQETVGNTSAPAFTSKPQAESAKPTSEKVEKSTVQSEKKAEASVLPVEKPAETPVESKPVANSLDSLEKGDKPVLITSTAATVTDDSFPIAPLNDPAQQTGSTTSAAQKVEALPAQ